MGHTHRYCPNNSPRDLPTCFRCSDVGHIQLWRGPSTEIRHANDQHVMDAVMWVILTVTVQTIHHAICSHVFDVVMSVILTLLSQET